MIPKPSIEANLFFDSLPKEDQPSVIYDAKTRRFKLTPAGDLAALSRVNYAWSMWLASVRKSDLRVHKYRYAEIMKS